MDIDRIIENVAKEYRNNGKNTENQEKSAQDQEQNPNFNTNYENLADIPLMDLCQLEIKTENDEIEIYKRFLNDAITYIDDFVQSDLCKDTNKDKGMYKCSHDTFEDCIRTFAIDYFRKYKYIHDLKREKIEGGYRFREDILQIGLEVYENLCTKYRKVFQIYDVCLFLGISKDNMYRLSEMHNNFLKKAHSATENSLRIGALSGRGNIAGNALILNHDYDYTRTTQIIHSNSSGNISAKELPQLEQIQDIVVEQNHVIVPDNKNMM